MNSLQPSLRLRAYAPTDRDAINTLASAAFAQYSQAYDDWTQFSKNISNMAALSDSGEIIVAELEREIVGAVAYVGPGKIKASFFNPDWPVMRMLVVHPSARGLGIGSQLTQACLDLALRDQAELLALHTSELMATALSLYERMGFTFHKNAPDIFGVRYGIYIKQLQHA